ncbi:PEP-CTERM sorting domain-containing protein [Erythrobacteraceae bacterium CFH 75059]|uniref:PEPxxWA-CTERM sorting domain-containing protein n=1 Tax=Qipengyuania thermophila TaxID=2509361 RepID=UPI00101F7738|nr:PEPxxWA-CTERM sorting domain-containing protein [Qipengyuania thermophila]TCD06599.1 PEP-CTERM sorting domain-containing protein [Erythrobacteraceae bacterium CFH 75059]
MTLRLSTASVTGLALALMMAVPASATPETTTSPNGGALPSGVTRVGGVVVDLKANDGTRVVSQLSASQMYRGFANVSENPVPGVATGNPLLFGTQTGFTPAVLANLASGLQSASFRITLFDGDTSPGNFDFNQNTFSVNGILVGNWSDVVTYETNADGTTLLSTSTGFGNNILSTGFFSLTDIAKLTSLFDSLVATGEMRFTLFDDDPNDNFFDFTQGVAGGLINVGTGPVVTPPSGAVPEPSTWALMLLGFGAVGAALRRTRHTQRVRFAFG